jgi:hypothetical protein
LRFPTSQWKVPSPVVTAPAPDSGACAKWPWQTTASVPTLARVESGVNTVRGLDPHGEDWHQQRYQPGIEPPTAGM